ncbi:hypothetical protein Sano_33 [Xylella phage Sano]|uniref:Sulfotransferase n=1 Tax=Xylella phage Sano TaxID=1415148 RepID=V5Q7J0_9CAUD|nr:hypothetical protein FGG50_gp33 [Xylella phage Sano]AHB12053.1 hypothetical protein Sano_33 [Xylella phage Sano]
MGEYHDLTIMLSLPRSRSAWMEAFVRPGTGHGCASLHNPLQQCASINELGLVVDGMPPGPAFISDVAAMFFFDHLVVRFPGAKFLIVHRPAREVAHSMETLGITPPLDLRKAEKQLIEIASSIRHNPWVLTGSFFELHNPSLLSAIYKFVTGKVVEPRHLHAMMKTNVQVSLEEQIRRTDIQKQRILFGKAKIIH